MFIAALRPWNRSSAEAGKGDGHQELVLGAGGRDCVQPGERAVDDEGAGVEGRRRAGAAVPRSGRGPVRGPAPRAQRDCQLQAVHRVGGQDARWGGRRGQSQGAETAGSVVGEGELLTDRIARVEGARDQRRQRSARPREADRDGSDAHLRAGGRSIAEGAERDAGGQCGGVRGDQSAEETPPAPTGGGARSHADGRPPTRCGSACGAGVGRTHEEGIDRSMRALQPAALRLTRRREAPGVRLDAADG